MSFFLHPIYITGGEFLLQLSPVSGGDHCHSPLISSSVSCSPDDATLSRALTTHLVKRRV